MRLKEKIIHKKSKGFTLLELLVTLAILAILIAIAVPIYKNQKENAAITAHNTNVHILETAAESYKQDNNHYPSSIEELQTDGYIKSVPKIPSSEELKDITEYTITQEGVINPNIIETNRESK